jgi:hypothetical protein
MVATTELKKYLDNEQLLVVLLSRLYFGTAGKKDVTGYLHSVNINYDRFYKIISIHGIRPFIFHVISSENIETDPQLYSRLKDFYVQNHLRSMEQATICSYIIKHLAKRDITAIPFKGVVFAHSYYNNMGLRESTDIDLLVSPADVKETEAFLQETGYQPKLSVPEYYRDYYIRNFKEIVYTAPATTNRNGYSVEVHWKLLNTYFGSFPGMDFFESGSSDIFIGDLRLRGLQPTYDFLAVCSNHFVKDMSVKFKYIIDAACLINKYQTSFDQDLIRQVSDMHHCRKRIEHGLYLADALLGQEITGPGLKYRFEQSGLTHPLHTPLMVRDFNVTSFSFIKTALRLQDSFADKVKFLMRCFSYFFLPTDNDLHINKDNNVSVFVLAIRRPFRLGLKAVSGVFR